MKNVIEGQAVQKTELKTLELKANLNPEQREYLEVLKDKMKKILGNKTKQELAKAGDLESLKKYKAILQDILEFLRTKEIKLAPLDLNKFKVKQIEKIQKIIEGNLTTRNNAQSNLNKKQIKALRGQIETLKRSDDEIITKFNGDEYEMWNERHFTVEEIVAVVLLVDKKILAEDLYIKEGKVNNEGIILNLKIGVAGVTDYIFGYVHAGRCARPGIKCDQTEIYKIYNDLSGEFHHTESVAQWWDHDKQWMKLGGMIG